MSVSLEIIPGGTRWLDGTPAPLWRFRCATHHADWPLYFSSLYADVRMPIRRMMDMALNELVALGPCTERCVQALRERYGRAHQ